MCLDDIKLGVGSRVATFWERTANSLFVSCLFLILVIFHSGLEGGTSLLTASVSGYC